MMGFSNDCRLPTTETNDVQILDLETAAERPAPNLEQQVAACSQVTMLERSLLFASSFVRVRPPQELGL